MSIAGSMKMFRDRPETWLDKFHDSQDCIGDIARQLEGLSVSFQNTGNVILAERLSVMAFDIKQATADARDAIHQNVSDACKESQSLCGLALSAAIHVLGKDQKPLA